MRLMVKWGQNRFPSIGGLCVDALRAKKSAILSLFALKSTPILAWKLPSGGCRKCSLGLTYNGIRHESSLYVRRAPTFDGKCGQIVDKYPKFRDSRDPFWSGVVAGFGGIWRVLEG